MLRRRSRVLCCELGRRGRRLRSLRGRRRRRAGLNLRLELCKLLRTGQVLQQVVFLLQLRVSLNQFFNLFFQHLHLLTNSIHQVTLHKILKVDNKALLSNLYVHSSFIKSIILLHVSYCCVETNLLRGAVFTVRRVWNKALKSFNLHPTHYPQSLPSLYAAWRHQTDKMAVPHRVRPIRSRDIYN